MTESEEKSAEKNTDAKLGGYSHVVKDKKTHVGNVLYDRLEALDDAPAEKPTKHMMKGGLSAFVVKGVLSKSECEGLVEGVNEEQDMVYEFWNPEEPDKTELRNVETVEVQDELLADVLWQRLKAHVVPSITIPEDDVRWESGCQGTWEAVGINPILLFANYGPGNHFSPHTDGNNVVDFNHRSLYSVLVYLNTVEDGGGTLLFDKKHPFTADDQGRLRFPNDAMTDKALAQCGEVFIFSQELFHEGEPVGEGSRKIIIRTDVMYKRNPPICDEEHDKEAFRLYQQATALEGQKKFVEAGVAYKKSVRLSEELARLLNIYGAF